ncbi:MAG: MarR family transcriptional regulator [Eubacteriales bacterium]|nr:MarR family transcriptional regulator [Eubacteriales bacterium]
MFFWDQHKTITSCYEKVTGSVCEKYHLTHMEYDILMFLHNNPQHNTAAEIVKVRKSTKSHVSSSLKDLESKGLIERIRSADNKKHIEIVLLNKADLIIEDGIKAQKEFAKIALDGLTEEEKRICKEVFNKICSNADKYMR